MVQEQDSISGAGWVEPSLSIHMVDLTGPDAAGVTQQL
jgi:hypothetical protein